MRTSKSAAMKYLDRLIGQPMTLGGLLAAIRETEQLTQAGLAQRLRVSKSHLCDIEKGRKTVSPERAARFARELGFSEEQFVRLALQQLVEIAGLHFRVALTAIRATRKNPTPAKKRAA